MRSLTDLIRLTRPVNLAIIAITMAAIKYGIIHPLVDFHLGKLNPGLSPFNFVAACMVMILLAAAGNIINDYFDIKVDRINKPSRVIVGKTVKRRVAMVLHHSLNIAATLIGIYLAWQSRLWIVAIIPVFMAGSLWSYSLTFKRQLWIGNFVVALMVCIVPLWTGMLEVNALIENNLNTTIGHDFFPRIWKWVIGYSAFAFILTLIREAQKDLEDLEGDKKSSFKTLPVVKGVKFTRIYILGLIALTIAGLGAICVYAPHFQVKNWPILLSLLILVVGPLMTSFFFTLIAKNPRHFGKASMFLKLTMLGGVILAFLLFRIPSAVYDLVQISQSCFKQELGASLITSELC